ncbi:MAG: hypothetical protein DHS20C10_08700 [marine bacterium B5-7]|nr:MAG: hypothetical protein DHS20C10_08700 [marine bacterium B5-7]
MNTENEPTINLYSRNVSQHYDKIAFTYPESVNSQDLLNGAVSLTIKTVTYRELDRIVNRIARYFQITDSAEENGAIALCFSRSPTLLFYIIAAWKLGRSIIPVDFDWACNNLLKFEELLKETHPSVMLCDDAALKHNGIRRALSPHKITLIPSSTVDRESEGLSDTPLVAGADLFSVPFDNDAYVACSSGTTGPPTAMRVKHGWGLPKCISGLVRYMALPDLIENPTGEQGAILLEQSPRYDVFLCAIQIALRTFTRIDIMPEALLSHPTYLYDRIKSTKQLLIMATPQRLDELIFNNLAVETALQTGDMKDKLTILSEGETLSYQLALKLDAISRLYNGHGGTGAPIGSDIARVLPNTVEKVFLGTPLWNDNFRCAKNGDDGELILYKPDALPDDLSEEDSLRFYEHYDGRSVFYLDPARDERERQNKKEFDGQLWTETGDFFGITYVENKPELSFKRRISPKGEVKQENNSADWVVSRYTITKSMRKVYHTLKTLTGYQYPDVACCLDHTLLDLGMDSVVSARFQQAIRRDFPGISRSLVESEISKIPTIYELGNFLEEIELVKNFYLGENELPTYRHRYILIHSIVGDVLYDYSKFADALLRVSEDTIIHTINFSRLLKEEIYSDLNALADFLLKVIKRLSSKGPWFIGGWSAGAVLAALVAKRLADTEGGAAVYLDLIDMPSPEAFANLHAPERTRAVSKILKGFQDSLIKRGASFPRANHFVEQVTDAVIGRVDLFSAQVTDSPEKMITKRALNLELKNFLPKTWQDSIVEHAIFTFRRLFRLFNALYEMKELVLSPALTDVNVFSSGEIVKVYRTRENLAWPSHTKVMHFSDETHWSLLINPEFISTIASNLHFSGKPTFIASSFPPKENFPATRSLKRDLAAAGKLVCEHAGPFVVFSEESDASTFLSTLAENLSLGLMRGISDNRYDNISSLPKGQFLYLTVQLPRGKELIELDEILATYFLRVFYRALGFVPDKLFSSFEQAIEMLFSMPKVRNNIVFLLLGIDHLPVDLKDVLLKQAQSSKVRLWLHTKSKPLFDSLPVRYRCGQLNQGNAATFFRQLSAISNEPPGIAQVIMRLAQGSPSLLIYSRKLYKLLKTDVWLALENIPEGLLIAIEDILRTDDSVKVAGVVRERMLWYSIFKRVIQLLLLLISVPFDSLLSLLSTLLDDSGEVKKIITAMESCMIVKCSEGGLVQIYNDYIYACITNDWEIQPLPESECLSVIRHFRKKHCESNIESVDADIYFQLFLWGENRAISTAVEKEDLLAIAYTIDIVVYDLKKYARYNECFSVLKKWREKLLTDSGGDEALRSQRLRLICENYFSSVKLHIALFKYSTARGLILELLGHVSTGLLKPVQSLVDEMSAELYACMRMLEAAKEKYTHLMKAFSPTTDWATVLRITLNFSVVCIGMVRQLEVFGDRQQRRILLDEAKKALSGCSMLADSAGSPMVASYYYTALSDIFVVEKNHSEVLKLVRKSINKLSDDGDSERIFIAQDLPATFRDQYVRNLFTKMLMISRCAYTEILTESECRQSNKKKHEMRLKKIEALFRHILAHITHKHLSPEIVDHIKYAMVRAVSRDDSPLIQVILDVMGEKFYDFAIDPLLLRTPLHMSANNTSAYAGMYYQALDYLLSRVPEKRKPTYVNKVMRGDQTALHCSAATGNVAVTELLLAHGANIWLSDQSGRTSLHLAAISGDEDIVRLLLNKVKTPQKRIDFVNKEDVNVRNVDGKKTRTALDFACKFGHKKVVDLLLLNGARSPNLFSLLNELIDFDMNEIFILLLKSQFSFWLESSSFLYDLHVLMKKLIDLTYVRMLSALIEKMLEHSSNPVDNKDLFDALVTTSLPAAAHFRKGSFKNLKKYAAPTEFFDDFLDWVFRDIPMQLFTKTCLALENDWELWITKQGNDLSRELGRTIDTHTVLHHFCMRELPLAQQAKTTRVVSKLLQLYEFPTSVYNEGITPLHRAVAARRLDLVEILLSRELCTVNTRDVSGRTPLHTAARQGSEEILKRLLAEKDSALAMRHKDLKGMRPLACAARSNSTSIVEYILLHGNYKEYLSKSLNSSGDSEYSDEIKVCMQKAVKHNQKEIVELFLTIFTMELLSQCVEAENLLYLARRSGFVTMIFLLTKLLPLSGVLEKTEPNKTHVGALDQFFGWLSDEPEKVSFAAATNNNQKVSIEAGPSEDNSRLFADVVVTGVASSTFSTLGVQDFSLRTHGRATSPRPLRPIKAMPDNPEFSLKDPRAFPPVPERTLSGEKKVAHKKKHLPRAQSTPDARSSPLLSEDGTEKLSNWVIKTRNSDEELRPRKPL